MPGVVLRIVPKQVFDFGSINTAGGTLTVVAARAIDVSSYQTADLIVRLHACDTSSGNAFAAGQSVTVSARLDAPTDEDAQEFTTSSDLSSVQFTNSDAPPTVKVFEAGPPRTSYLRVYVKGAATMSYTGNFRVTLSVDLNLRS